MVRFYCFIWLFRLPLFNQFISILIMKLLNFLALISILSINLSIQAQSVSLQSSDSTKIETFPVWKGCEDNPNYESPQECFNAKLAEHIRKNLKYPGPALENDVEGRVNMSFVISTEGKVTNVKVDGDKRWGYGLEEEAIRVVNLIPDMQPATSNGQAVNMKYKLPILFKLM